MLENICFAGCILILICLFGIPDNLGAIPKAITAIHVASRAPTTPTVAPGWAVRWAGPGEYEGRAEEEIMEHSITSTDFFVKFRGIGNNGSLNGKPYVAIFKAHRDSPDEEFYVGNWETQIPISGGPFQIKALDGQHFSGTWRGSAEYNVPAKFLDNDGTFIYRKF